MKPVICTACGVAAEEVPDEDAWECPSCLRKLLAIEYFIGQSPIPSDN